MSHDTGHRPWLGTGRVNGRTELLVGHHGAGTASALAESIPGVPASMRELIGSWERHAEIVLQLAAQDGPISLDDVEWLAPVMPHKLLCLGANYARHNAEMLGDAAQEMPYTFLKPPSTTLVGHRHAGQLPRHAAKVDYEAELAVVIGRRCRDVTADRVGEVIFGYSILDDVSARDWVPATSWMGFDWTMLKGFDESAPMGPWITPAAWVPDPQRLDIRLWVNGELRQDSNTSDMVFGVARIIEHISHVMTLEPGDVIATGTPDGVAFGRDPSPWLGDGDVVRIDIEGLGTLEHSLHGVPGGGREPEGALRA